MGKGILNKWDQLELLKATKDFLLWYIFSGGSIGWCGVSFLHGTVKIYLRRDWMQACDGLVCGKFSILLLMVFRRTLWAEWWVLRRALRRVFSGRGLVGVEGVWWAWRSHLLHPWRIRPTPVSLRPPNLIKLTKMDLYSFTVKHGSANKFEENNFAS